MAILICWKRAKDLHEKDLRSIEVAGNPGPDKAAARESGSYWEVENDEFPLARKPQRFYKCQSSIDNLP